jgi:hypothetical protein
MRPTDLRQGLFENPENFGIPPITPTNFTFPYDPTANGVISIYVLNRLAVPNSDLGVNNDVQINFFVSGCDDFDFNQPTDSELQRMSFQNPFGAPAGLTVHSESAGTLGSAARPRPDTVVPSTTVRAVATMDSAGQASAAMGQTEGENTPVDPPVKTDIAETNKPEPTLNDIFFGEKFVSFRSLMKRYMFANNFVPFDIAPGGIGVEGFLYEMVLTVPNFPPFPGPSPTTENWDEFTGGINFCPPAMFLTDFRGGGSIFPNGARMKFNSGSLTYFHYVTKMFVGWRGSIRSKYIMNGPSRQSHASGADTLRVRRLSASNRAFGMDPPIGGAPEAIYPASGGRWNQGMAINRVSVGLPGTGTSPAAFTEAVTGGQIAGNQYAPNWTNSTATQSQSAQLLGNSLFAGSHVTPRNVQPAVEVELPFYEPTRFEFVDNYLINTQAKAAHEVRALLTRGPDQDSGAGTHAPRNARSFVSRWIAPGEDFQCFYLLNAPIYFNNSQFQLPNQDGDLIRYDSVKLEEYNRFPLNGGVIEVSYPYTIGTGPDEWTPPS